MSDETAFQTALDAEGENAGTTRLVFADWLRDRDDPRAEGYALLSEHAIYPNNYMRDGPASRTWRRYEDDLFGQTKSMPHVLPVVWFDALEGGVIDDRDYMTYPSRKEAEDAAALAFAKLTDAQKEEARNHPKRGGWGAPAADKKELVDLYACLACGRYTVCEKGNFHPWCSCGYDQFDWNNGYTGVTREEADKIIEKEGR